jgi:hypothetical protein
VESNPGWHHEDGIAKDQCEERFFDPRWSRGAVRSLIDLFLGRNSLKKSSRELRGLDRTIASSNRNRKRSVYRALRPSRTLPPDSPQIGSTFHALKAQLTLHVARSTWGAIHSRQSERESIATGRQITNTSSRMRVAGASCGRHEPSEVVPQRHRPAIAGVTDSRRLTAPQRTSDRSQAVDLIFVSPGTKSPDGG